MSSKLLELNVPGLGGRYELLIGKTEAVPDGANLPGYPTGGMYFVAAPKEGTVAMFNEKANLEHELTKNKLYSSEVDSHIIATWLTSETSLDEVIASPDTTFESNFTLDDQAAFYKKQQEDND